MVSMEETAQNTQVRTYLTDSTDSYGPLPRGLQVGSGR